MCAKGMVVMCNFIQDLFERIGNEAANVCRFSKKQTLSSCTGPSHVTGSSSSAPLINWARGRVA